MRIHTDSRLFGLTFTPRTRMRLIVDVGEMLEIKMGIDLGSRQIGVAEQLLYSTQIAGGFKHVGRKAVA